MNKDDEKPVKTSSAGYLKYTALGFQLLFAIAIFGWIGWWLDDHFHVKNKLFTAFMMLFAVVGSLIKLVKDLLNEQKRGK